MASISESPRGVEEKQHIVKPLVAALSANGVNFPSNPTVESLVGPRQWLIRGENSTSRLLLEDRTLTPQPGQMGSHGVFFGDCIAPLMLPEQGVYYVYPTAQVSQDWLRIPSPEYRKLAERIREKNGLRADSVGDALNADSLIYKSSATYSPKDGIATSPRPLPIQSAHLILLTEGLLTPQQLQGLPETIRNKVVIFHLEK